MTGVGCRCASLSLPLLLLLLLLLLAPVDGPGFSLSAPAYLPSFRRWQRACGRGNSAQTNCLANRTCLVRAIVTKNEA